MPFGSLTTAADLDGDHRPDIATAGASRREGAGYALDITLRLSSVEVGVITVRTPGIAGRITARDLDGDSDRDLILESFDRVPLAVVLNEAAAISIRPIWTNSAGGFGAIPARSKIRRRIPICDQRASLRSARPLRWRRLASRPGADTSYADPLPDECFVILRHSISGQPRSAGFLLIPFLILC